MRLVKLKLSGFKTFVDPTSVLTPGQLVGVVGPNGCGKSNIIDAVRWVLGESKASALRGESMQDVIFNGSTTRKPVSRASVELIFDNSQGRASGQWSRYAEISVKRVLDRSGDSTYLINNVAVRRKDVIDLFLGTGLGPRAYAIIEQGMISRIIEARPEEIRGFLEEAAGVTKYKERRRETEHRLSDARDNLARLDDIRNELDTQIVRLDAQAVVARRYQALQDELTRKQQLLWLLKREEAHASRVAREQDAATVQREIDLASEQLREIESLLDAARETHLLAGDAVQRAQADFYAASAEVTRIETASRHQHDMLDRIEARLLELEREIEVWRQRLDGADHEGRRWQELLEHAERRCEQAGDRHLEIRERLPELEDMHRQAEEGVTAIRRELGQAEQQLRVEETQRQAAVRTLEALASRRQRLDGERQQWVVPDVSGLPLLEARVEELGERQERLGAEAVRLQGELPQAQADLRSALEDERTVQKRVTELRARRDALVALQNRIKAQGSLGDWLREQGLDQVAPLWPQLRMEAGWENAIEAVLRERLAALCVEDEGVLARLAGERAPALLAVLLPAQAAVDPLSADWGSLPVDVPAPRPLLSLVSCEQPVWQPALACWLGQVHAVDSLTPWLVWRSRLPAGVTLVSRDGNLLDAHGLTLFAPDQRTHGVLERQREIDGLADALATVQHEVALAQQAVERGEQRVQAVQDQLQRVRREVQESQQQRHALQVEVLKLQQAHSRHEERVAALQRDEDDLQRQESSERERLLAAELAIERQHELVDMQRTRLEGAMDVARARGESLRDARSLEAALSRESQEAHFSLRECQTRLEEIERNRELADVELVRRQDELLSRQEERAGIDLSGLFDALQAALERRVMAEERLTTCRQAQDEAMAHLRQLEETRLRGEHVLKPQRTRLAELHLQIQAARLAEEQYLGRLVEAGADEAVLLPLLTPDLKETVLAREVGRLGRELAELGPVNLTAVEELALASERKQYLDDQHLDLATAISTLEDAIRRIDRETREQLQQTYDTVNREFGDLFPRLFGGGQARLVLTGEDLLDAGVQIIAQPPGKKNTSIHLLSGGEKALTAIALVFAMFALNPAPFCMLDEVDAPLDDTNTERFCAMVKRMSVHTQFLFISHSKITMEMASQLVGVTMQEQGVSRIVEVDIEQALQLADAVV